MEIVRMLGMVAALVVAWILAGLVLLFIAAVLGLI